MNREEREKIKVLLVDDEDHFRKPLARQLQVRGFEVFDVSDGESALEVVRTESPSVVVLDQKMPKMSGIDTLIEIKKVRPLTEVIMLTGQATAETALEILKLGAFDYLMKPTKLEELLYKVEDAYEKKQIRERTIKAKYKNE